MTYTPYAIPAVIALLAKVGIFFYARYSRVHNLKTRIYLIFLFCMAVQNLMEIQFFTADAEGGASNPPTVSGLLYFGVSILAIALLLHLAVILATNSREQGNLSRRGLLTIYIPATVLEVLLFTTPLLVAGFERMGYTYTRVPGQLFFLWELYAIGYLVAAVAFLFYGAWRQGTAFERLQNRLLLIGLLPILLVVVAVIGFQHFGFRVFNATATLPFAVTFFLIVTAYATHQYRLFDIAFFIPWSTVRKRKTAFYQRIQALIAEISDMSSVSRIVQGLSDVLHCPVVLVGGPRPALAMAGEALGVARFPIDELRKIRHILVANEIAQAMPATYALMKRHKVAAVVPFHPHSDAAASWMLLGEAFGEQVYTSHDFQVVELLFARLADHFLDKQLLLRSQLSDAQREMQSLQERLATAWEQLETSRKKQQALEIENHQLRKRNARLLRHDLADVELELMDEIITGKKTLDEYGAEFEARLIEKALDHCNGNRERAADLLGISVSALTQKILRYGLET